MNLNQKEDKVISHFENYSKRAGVYLVTKNLGREYPLLKFIGEIVKQKNNFPGNKLYSIDLTPNLIEYAKEHRCKKEPLYSLSLQYRYKIFKNLTFRWKLKTKAT